MATRGTKLHLPHFTYGNASGETLFFIHGWPDNKELFDAQLQRLSPTFRCVCVDLPHFGADVPGVSRWGYDFDELADMCAEALSRSLQEAGQGKAALVVHDWGAFVGMRLQRRHPHLVSRMVVMDVAWTPTMWPLYKLVGAGLQYQYWLMAAWILAVCVPVVGEPLGRLMTRGMVSALRRLYGERVPRTSVEARPRAPSCLMNYPYFYVHLRGWSEALGLRASFDARCGTKDSPVPTLFLYGADKAMKFHCADWEAGLRARPDCRVVPLRRVGGHVGHWLPITAADEVNREMHSFLVAQQSAASPS